jgi:hypothetical protein
MYLYVCVCACTLRASELLDKYSAYSIIKSLFISGLCRVKMNILAAQRGSIQMGSNEYNPFMNKVSLNKTAQVAISYTTFSKDL